MKRSILLLFALITLAFGGAATAAAQEATPGGTPAGPSEGYPVAVHQGTCDAPNGEPVAQLDDATAAPPEGTETVGQSVSGVMLETSGAIDLTLDDISSESYVVAVHASPNEFGTIVACGQIAGYNEGGKVVVALTPVGDSTTVGVAIVDQDEAGVFDLGDGQVQLTVYLFNTTSDDMATPAA